MSIATYVSHEHLLYTQLRTASVITSDLAAEVALAIEDLATRDLFLVGDDDPQRLIDVLLTTILVAPSSSSRALTSLLSGAYLYADKHIDARLAAASSLEYSLSRLVLAMVDNGISPDRDQVRRVVFTQNSNLLG